MNCSNSSFVAGRLSAWFSMLDLFLGFVRRERPRHADLYHGHHLEILGACGLLPASRSDIVRTMGATDGMPRARNAMFRYDEQMTDLVFDIARARLKLESPPLDFPGDKATLESAIKGLITPGGRDPVEVLGVYEEHLAPAIISTDSPRYLAFIPAAPTKASLLFDVIVSVSSIEGSSWLPTAGAIVAENQALGFLANLAGMPEGSGGVFVSGGSAGNLSALVVARDTAEHRRGRPVVGKPRAVISDEAHASVAKALHVIGVDPLVVKTKDHRLTEPDLRAALEADHDHESIVVLVATAGTTNAGVVDDLNGVARVAQELGVWMHVDGAYGAAGLFAPSVRDRFNGIEKADSLVVDPHKWLLAPFDSAALIYREPHLAKAVHTQDASYLDPLRAAGAWNASDYSYGLTRRARGLPFWFSLAVNGTDAYCDAIEYTISLAKQTARLIETDPVLELVREPELSTVIYKRDGWDYADYQKWSEKLLADQIGFVTPSLWEGEGIARLTFVNPETTLEMVEEILETMT
jgi:aromatic-L-amino-acid/L-tryptophan decarboxylase